MKNDKKLKLMKTKLFLVTALICAASMSAQAGVRFGFSIGLPLPVVVAAPVAPVVVSAPLVAVPPVVVTVPACPGVGYVWAPGYWSVCGYSRAWVLGCWHYRPVAFGYAHPHGWRRW